MILSVLDMFRSCQHMYETIGEYVGKQTKQTFFRYNFSKDQYGQDVDRVETVCDTTTIVDRCTLCGHINQTIIHGVKRS